MQKKNLSIALREVTFHCHGCKHSFKAEPLRVEDCAEQTHHPFQYFSVCSQCQGEVGQAHHERALLKA